MTNVAELPVSNPRARTHAMFSFLRLAELLASAETAGGLRALADAEPAERLTFRCWQEITHSTRVRLYEAQLRMESK